VFTFKAFSEWIPSMLDALYKDERDSQTPPNISEGGMSDKSEAFVKGEQLLDELIEKSKNLEG